MHQPNTGAIGGILPAGYNKTAILGKYNIVTVIVMRRYTVPAPPTQVAICRKFEYCHVGAKIIWWVVAIGKYQITVGHFYYITNAATIFGIGYLP